MSFSTDGSSREAIQALQFELWPDCKNACKFCYLTGTRRTMTSRFQVAQFNVEHFSGMHNWYACSHARPTFCNVCRESLSGVTSHGLSCEGTVASRACPPSTLSFL